MKISFSPTTQIEHWKYLLVRHRYDLLVVISIFLVAFQVRLLYQSTSVVYGPQRADAGKYIRTAANLKLFGVHSIEGLRPDNKPPESRTDLSPGYPLFLSKFINQKNVSSVTGNDGLYYTIMSDLLVEEVLFYQALIGALTVVLTFILARFCLSFWWASFGGLLVAFNPHLIAINGFLLTESLFIFVVISGLVALAFAWRTDNILLTLLGILLICASVHIRALNYAFPFLIALIFILHPQRRAFQIRKKLIINGSIFLLGFLIVHIGSQTFKATKMKDQGYSPKEYVAFRSPTNYFKTAVIPPNFFINQTSHIQIENSQENWSNRTTKSFSEEPTAYLKWNLISKFIYMWHWDNAYNGDVYIYPMQQKGFELNGFLRPIHLLMHGLHWPMYILALLCPFILIYRFRKGLVSENELNLLIPILAFVYYLGTLWILSWLPRYTIVARPYATILAVTSLSWIISSIGSAYSGKVKSTMDA